MKAFEIGQEVVRISGEFRIGNTGAVIAIDSEKNRAQVDWTENVTTWVSFKVIELTSVPYQIIKPKRYGFPKYQRI